MNDINALLESMHIGVWDWILLIVLSLPPFFILASKRVSGGAKVWWFILTSIFSWLAYAVFLFMAPKKNGAAGTKGVSQ